MLDGYVSEKEQLESIKKWWQENGKFIAIAIVLGLAIGLGWRYWHTIEKRRAENASMIYQSVLNANAKNKLSTVQGGAKILMENFSRSPYASLAALLAAKASVSNHQLPIALTQLQWIVQHAPQKRLKQIARLSIARILLAEGNATAALTELKTVDDKSFEPLIDWVKGDGYVQEKNAKLAQQYYTQAKNALAGFPPAVNFLNQQIAQPIA